MKREILPNQSPKILFSALQMRKHYFILDSVIHPSFEENKLRLYPNCSHYRITTDHIWESCQLPQLSWNFYTQVRTPFVAYSALLTPQTGFPQFVDRLPPEKGDNPGPEPTIYSKSMRVT